MFGLIGKYVWRAVLPYFALAWLLLTAILFLQQSSRFADLFGGRVPLALLWQIVLALLPNVVAFTSPLAILAGIVIGFGRLQGDSELVAMRAAGVGTWRLVMPCLLLGALLTAGSFYVNLAVIPESARVLRRVALQSLLFKLESPVEPGVFTTEIPNYVIYVKEGDREAGVWEKVFLYSAATGGITRLITAEAGRIDSAREQSELVLQNATVTTLNLAGSAAQPIAVEQVAGLRVALATQRQDILRRLQTLEATPDELGLAELAQYAAAMTGKERLEAELLWQRRVTLAIAPLVFAWLGIALSLRFGRGGRGWGSILALVSMVGYYLLALFGEQLARSSILTPFWGVWLATFAALLGGAWWLLRTRGGVAAPTVSWALPAAFLQYFQGRAQGRWRLPFFGALERDILMETGHYFLLATVALSSLYLIFTVFELWKFVGAAQNGRWLLSKYLVFLTPLVVWQIAPSALMIAILTTYALKTRRSETIAWWSAGQSVYRLLVPGLLFAAMVGWGSWELQERVLPLTNRWQDALRAQLRSSGATGEQNGRFWVAEGNRIYSFSVAKDGLASRFKDVSVYQFAPDGIRLAEIMHGDEAEWQTSGRIDLRGQTQKISWEKSHVEMTAADTLTVEAAAPVNPFGEIITKVAHLDAEAVRRNIAAADSETEKRTYRVALQQKYAGGIIPLVIAFFSAPFALSFGRRETTFSLLFAFGNWLIFTGMSIAFDRLGENGFLAAPLAVWSPLILFTCGGIYWLTKAKT